MSQQVLGERRRRGARLLPQGEYVTVSLKPIVAISGSRLGFLSKVIDRRMET